LSEWEYCTECFVAPISVAEQRMENAEF